MRATTVIAALSARLANLNRTARVVIWLLLLLPLATVGWAAVSMHLRSSPKPPLAAGTAAISRAVRNTASLMPTPLIDEDFSAYANTAQLLGNSALYWVSEDQGAEYISLDTTTGYGSSTKSMRYTIPDRTSDPDRCEPIPIRRIMLTDTGVAKPELWVELRVKFSANFDMMVPTEWDCSTAQGMNLFSLNTENASRINLMGLYGEQWVWSYPNGPSSIDETVITSHPPDSIFDNQWHQIRFHVKLSSATDAADGAAEFWLDGVPMSNHTDIVINRESIWSLDLGDYRGRGPSQEQSWWWGSIVAWDANPAWGPALSVTAPADSTVTAVDSILVSGTVADTTATVTANAINLPVQGDSTFEGYVPLSNGSNTITIVATDSLSNTSTVTRIVILQSLTIPPDPATVAPAINQTIPTSMFDATSFLYTGPDSIQTGVAAGTIKPMTVTVLRGRVLDRSGSALPGVEVTIVGHPEYGKTHSRADGWYDIAANGGGTLVVNLQRSGYLPAQREAKAPWRDYLPVPDVRLVQLDTAATTIDFSVPVQTARGSTVTDSDGTRRATLMFRQGTTATMVFPNDSTAPLSSLTVRATEYTVGAGWQEAMPAELPPASAYTYAVEFSVDEAIQAGARDVTFSDTVAVYVENFLNYPVGRAVPAGYYDREKSAWVPMDNGRIVKIIGVSSGDAQLDIDGSNTAASSGALAALGIDTLELEQLATLYGIGQSLWRVPVMRFSPQDYNHAWAPPSDAKAPLVDKIKRWLFEKKPCVQDGSVIGCETQTLGEVIGIAGTPYTLHYNSDRSTGYVEGYTLDIPLTDATPHDSLKTVLLEVRVAGQMYTNSFTASANQTTTFTWDGKDGYGRTLQGQQPVYVRIGYVYPALVMNPAAQAQSFARLSGNMIAIAPARQKYIVWNTWGGYVGTFDARGLGLGGWSISDHHSYDPSGRKLYFGDGGSRSPSSMPLSINAAAGTGNVRGLDQPVGDGLSARSANLVFPLGVAAAPDGSFYFTDGSSRIRKVSALGIISTVAGNDTTGFAGDGGPATSGRMLNPHGIALGPDGSLYIADNYNHRIRKVDANGIITTIAGTGGSFPASNGSFSGDGGPATSAALSFPDDVAVAGDGTIYITDTGNFRIRQITPDGRIGTIAGTGIQGYQANDSIAASARLFFPHGIALGPDGSVYFSDYTWIRKISTGGRMRTVAGDGSVNQFGGDGGPATAAKINAARGVAVSADGTIYFSDQNNRRIRAIAPNGIISTIAGNGEAGGLGDFGPASAAQINNAYGVDVTADGAVLIADPGSQKIRRIESSLPGVSSSDIVVAAESGGEVYVLNSAGRHLRTLHALTADTLLSFGYNSAGQLITLTDGDSNVTTIERDSVGNPTGILSPYGQRTTLSRNLAGYLATIVNPNADTVKLTYHTSGLLSTLTDPRANDYEFTYDSLGRFTRDDDPASGYKTLTQSVTADTQKVTVATALGRNTVYSFARIANGDFKRSVIGSDGLTSSTITTSRDSIRVMGPDSMVSMMASTPDPRFGMNAPIVRTLKVTSPGGLVMSSTGSRKVVLADSTNVFSLTSATDSFTVNGRVSTSVYDAATRRFTVTSSVGRQSRSWIDSQGRVLRDSISGIAALAYTYDSNGRRSTAAQGARTTTFAYDSLSRLASTTDPLNRVESYFYNSANHMTRLVMTNGREVLFAYDKNGNVSSITPPTRSAHTFGYTPVDLSSSYTAPALGVGEVPTQYTYNLDRQVTKVLKPDSTAIDFGYDSAGRLSSLTIPGVLYSYAYGSTNGLLSSLAARGDTIRFTYDGALPTKFTWSGRVAGSVGFKYDNDFRLSKQFVNNADTVNFGYDNDGLLTSAGNLSLTRSSSNGLLTGTTLGNVTTAQTYSTLGELDSLSAAHSGTNLLSQKYVRDALGRITQLTETRGGTSKLLEFVYDSVGQLITVKSDSVVTASYAYDGNGNRTSVTTSSDTANATTDGQDRLLTHGSASYTYTKAGELKERVVGTDTTRYTYDALGNLVTVRLPNGTTIDYVIDGSNARTGKKINGTLKRGWLYGAPLQIVAELDSVGGVATRFVYSTRVNVPDYMVKAGVTYRIVTDRLGSVRLVVNSSTGAVTQELAYDAFGQITLDSNPGFQPFGFGGGQYDADTKLVRFGARDYESESGRWTAKDPIGFGGGDSNLYSYVSNDPVSFTDPDGICPMCIVGGFWAAYEIGSSIYDAYNALRTALDPCASGAEKGATFALAMAGVFLPFGGASGAAKHLDEVGDVGRSLRRIDDWPAPAAHEVRVSRWMSEAEYFAMKETGNLQFGAGGRAYVTSLGAPKPAGSGRVRVDFNLPKAALDKGGATDWFMIHGISRPPITGITRQ